MKIVIDIPEDDYKEVKEDTYSGTPFENRVFSAIANGKPYEEQKIGKWIDGHCMCSICKWYSTNRYGFAVRADYNYCPDCGAKMEVDE